ncbi:curli-like amyloid fiber formation chaperone CsgH [Asticcacaulis sp.]|uniref:curli-like amyloid fiber formation chaperone CsgH n=1 Tax=Asticcacaulis sp. TaxID=1872648 RepID=UPI002BA4BFDA|nr:curli-like amyloid fiber formation chaperone CsgH [Asticcacaulis sp.]HTM79766.1 curli-like amyloid fiber formation chaperone CsgH [Asticcacaulis sp.]
MMFDTAAVTAHLEIVQAAKGLAVNAFVGAGTQPDLRWRLNLTSRNPGGTSTVTQGGLVEIGSSEPVGTVTVTANSQGRVTLVVLDGDQEVARDEVNFGADTKTTR